MIDVGDNVQTLRARLSELQRLQANVGRQDERMVAYCDRRSIELTEAITTLESTYWTEALRG